MKLIIEDDEGRKTVVPFVRDEITIGRQEGNTIRLTERNVSRRHARLLRQNGHVMVEDLGSYNGIRINGDRIQGQVQVNDGDLIQIGDYDLAVQREAAEHPAHQSVTNPALDRTDENAVHRNGANGAARPTPDDKATVPALPLVQPTPGGASMPDEPDEANPDDVTLQPSAPAEDTARRQSTAIIHMDQVEKNPVREVVDLDPAEAPRLVVLNTELAGREFACARTELKIGRTDENDIAIDHRSLSRTHCKIVREESGEWRVVDMQSANGLMVNGESYAQSALRSQDLLELGHVKLKFLAAGEKFDPSEAVAEPGRGDGKGAVIGIVAFVVLATAGAGVWYFRFQRPSGTTGPVKVAPVPGVGEQPIKRGPDAPELTPEQQSALVAAKLTEAREKIDALQWPEAIKLLEECYVGESLHSEAQHLITDLKAEKPLLDAIAKAEQLIDQDQLVQAKEALESAAHTKFAQARHSEVNVKLGKATQARLAAGNPPKDPLAAKDPVRPPPVPPPPKAAPTPRQQAEGLLAESRTPYKRGKETNDKAALAEAKALLDRCIKVDPKFPDCHMLMGATLGLMQNGPGGAKEYREFLRLAPDHPKAAQVRALLENYDANSR